MPKTFLKNLRKGQKSSPSLKVWGSRKTLSKKVKVLNLLSKGISVSWKTLRSRFDLTSPRAMIDQLRLEGNMVYINKTSNGTSYRLGTPTKNIISAGIAKLYGKQKYAYSNQ